MFEHNFLISSHANRIKIAECTTKNIYEENKNGHVHLIIHLDLFMYKN